MKIAVWHNLPSGGGKRALYDHVKGLVERGHTVEVWCPSTADTSYLSLGELAVEHVLQLDWQPRNYRSRYAHYFEDYWNVNSQIRALDEHSQEFADQINQRGFDLLFANSCRFFQAPFVGRYVTLPKILYLQEPHRSLYEALPSLPWPALPVSKDGRHPLAYSKDLLVDLVRTQAHRIRAREELRNARSFDELLVNSYFSRESLLRAYGIDSKVCYLGIDTKRFVPLERTRERILVGIGAILWHKNIEFVLESIARLAKPRPALIWIGNDVFQPYLEHLKSLAESNDIQFIPRVRVDDEELVQILNRAMAMVYAPRLEPFGYASLEANACGLPVVGVAEGGLRETIRDGVNGFLVDRDPQAMADAIDRLLGDESLWRQLSLAGRKNVLDQWSADASVNRLLTLFQELLGHSCNLS